MKQLPPKPRVHWVSPLAPAETDIANYTTRILPELTDLCEVVLWTDAPQWDRSLEALCEVRRLDPDRILPADFTRAGGGASDAPDAVFVHIGNSWVFHSGLLRLVRRIPAIVVLHDLAVQELIVEAIGNRLFPRDSYVSDMARWHGPRGRTLAEAVIQGEVRALDASQDIPGFEVVLDRAVSVLTHTRTAYEAVVARGVVSAYLLDLPYRPSAQPVRSWRPPDGPLSFMQFGFIGPNRRLLQILEALAPLRDEVPFRFDIMGHVWDEAYVMRRVDELGLQGRVSILGFVSEARLDAALASAHLVFNLRHPTMGEASGSQLRIWNAAAAAVVTDRGWYGDLPDDTVFKIPLESEKESLQTLIRQLAADRDIGAQVGSAGRARLEKLHTPARYAEGIAYVASRVAADGSASVKARVLRQSLAQCAPSPYLLADMAGRRC